MLDAGRGLRDVPREQLVAMLRAVHQAKLATPLKAEEMACIGLQRWQEALLGALRGLDARAIQTVLVCVLAERDARP